MAAFGRLDVHFPDGRFESFLLEGDTVSIGRAGGNTISLEAETVSRYHASITRKDGVIAITDLESENGTLVDGMRLTANEGRILGGIEEIQVGDLRVIYTPVDDTPTMPIEPSADDTERIEREELDFQLSIDRTGLDVWPAASASAELTITNSGDETRRFTVTGDGLPQGWLRVNRPEVMVHAGETSYVLINVRPPRRPDTQPGAYRVTVRVAPVDAPEQVLEFALSVQINTYSGFGIALSRQNLTLGENPALYLHNQGSQPLNIALSATQSNQTLILRLPTQPVALGAGQRLKVPVQMAPRRRPLIGRTARHRFFINAQAQPPAHFLTAVEGWYTLPPQIPTWGAISVGGIFLSVIVIGLLALLGVLAPPPEPRISDFTLNAAQVAQGDPLVASWQAQDIDAFEVRVDDQPVAQLDGDATSVEIDSSALSGEVYVSIQGSRGGDEVSAGASVRIYRPMQVRQFSVTPEQVVRNVVTALTIEWDIPGAVSTRLEGLADFTNAPLQASYGASDRLEGIGGIPTAPLVIALIAEDEAGNLREERITVTIQDPICTANSDMILHEGPDTRYQQVGRLEAGTDVVVDAQYTGADWLRVALEGVPSSWGPRAAFTCADYFQVADLRTVVEVPPLPTPTLGPPTPTFAPLPSLTPTILPLPTLTPTLSG